MNDTKRDNMGVHEAINMLLWYCQEIRGGTYEVSSLLLCKKEKRNMKPQKLTVVGGKRKQVDFDSRSEEYKNYNKTRWNYDKKLTRFYNSSAWRSTSKLVLLRDDYVCQMCGGEATMVDHIIPIKKDWNRRLDLDNLQASCKACNDAKANRENYGKK